MGGVNRLCILSADSAGPGLARQIQTVWNSDRYYWSFFHLHFLETKAPIRLPVCRLVWAFVVRMYQRWISRDKVHMIFKYSKLNAKDYTRRLCRRVYSFPLTVCPLVLSFVRQVACSFVILLINCSLSPSLFPSPLPGPPLSLPSPSLSSLFLSLSPSLSHSLYLSLLSLSPLSSSLSLSPSRRGSRKFWLWQRFFL